MGTAFHRTESSHPKYCPLYPAPACDGYCPAILLSQSFPPYQLVSTQAITESLGELFVKYQGQDQGLEPAKPEELAKLISVDHFKGSSGGATLSAS